MMMTIWDSLSTFSHLLHFERGHFSLRIDVIVIICMFVCLFIWDFRATREFFTHKEMSPLPMTGCKFGPIPGTHVHGSVRVPLRATPTVTRGIRLYWWSLRTRDTRTYCRAFSSGAVTTCFHDWGLSWPGFEHLIFRLRGRRSKPSRSNYIYAHAT